MSKIRLTNEIDLVYIPKPSKAEEILRKHFHGLSDEQFAEEIKHYPFTEFLAASKEICELSWQASSNYQLDRLNKHNHPNKQTFINNLFNNE
jgi:hypothetical protein